MARNARFDKEKTLSYLRQDTCHEHVICRIEKPKGGLAGGVGGGGTGWPSYSLLGACTKKVFDI